MNKYIATVIKTGNSFALRVPKGYIEQSDLLLGEKIELPPSKRVQEHSEADVQNLWKELQELKPFSEIVDPGEWQRDIRQDRDLPGRV